MSALSPMRSRNRLIAGRPAKQTFRACWVQSWGADARNVRIADITNIATYKHVSRYLRVWVHWVEAARFCRNGLVTGWKQGISLDQCRYSVRSARAGSTDAARRAGINPATHAAASKVANAAASAPPLTVVMSYNCDFTRVTP